MLTQVHQASSQDALHVIFVHGLGGNARTTWMSNSADPATFWPEWIGEDVGCNVWIAGYNASPSAWFNETTSLADLGEALFTALQVEPGLQGQSLVLVGHSLGGLAIKSGMTQAESLKDPQRLNLLERISGVVFIGTPHQGAHLATIVNKLSRLLKINPPVGDMTKHNSLLSLQSRQFRSLLTQRSLDVRVFFESKGFFSGYRIFGLNLGSNYLIVDGSSSDPGIAGVTPIPIDGDHFEIAKPKSRQDLVHKALVDLLKDITNRLAQRSSAKAPSLSAFRSLPSDIQTRLQNASAALLSWPSTLADGRWLERPELEGLIERLKTEPSSTHILLGDPGCGKSALLVHLAQEKQAAGWQVLAIKADQLPPEVLDRGALERHLNLGADTATVVRELAKNGPVLVLIDQVDALADLVVQHSGRLRVMLDLVQDLSDVDGVHTVVSSRTFEQKHDPALRNLYATVVQLELPEWTTVRSVLSAKGMQVEAWNQDIQQVLRSPHALDTFLSLLGNATEPEALRSFHGLQETQWETQVLCDASGKRGATLHHLANLMADREVLGIPLAQVEDHHAEIKALTAAGLLRVDPGPGRVEFRHQTLYEFVRARSFLEESGSLTETVRAQQANLRIRPQLWHALGYFREVSPEEYGAEIRRLWDADLRPHLKMLLIEFLGLQTAPILAERQLIEQTIEDRWSLPRFIGAAVGSPGWFEILSTTHLPRLMSLPEDQAKILVPLLRLALRFNADSVVDLVRRHWLCNEERDVLSWEVLGFGEVAPQVGPWLDSLILITERSQIAEWAVEHLAGVISAAYPDEAPRLLAAWVKRQLDSASTRLASSSTEDASLVSSLSKGVNSIFEMREFHDMEAIAEASPRAYIENLWPLLLKGLSLCAFEDSSVVIGYKQIHGLLFQDFDDEAVQYERPLLRSIQLGIEGWAASDPESFLDFVTQNAQSELLLIHRFLAAGLLRAAAHSPHRVYEYLIGDPRRMVLGPYTDAHKHSVALIEAISPMLDDNAYGGLEALLRHWRYYTAEDHHDDADIRHRRLLTERKHRLRLLRALSPSRRSTSLQRLVDEEERAFPGLTSKDIHFTGVQFIGSPVSAKQMSQAADADILNLFDELRDDTAWDHPRHDMKGGAIQAGRQLAELAKTDLDKALRIVRALDPVHNEIPVSCVLRELVPAGLAVPELYALIIELEDKGFVGSGFRQDAAHAVTNAPKNEAPVPEELINRMERWLVSIPAESFSEIKTETKNASSAILWGLGTMESLPGGNYPVLSALTSACLMAEPPRLDRWISILERHLKCVESPRVWEAMVPHELACLNMVERSRAEAFINQLVSKIPCIVNGRRWAHFVAHSFRWASATAAERWLMKIVEGSEEGLQGAGELAVLRHALYPAETWPRELIERFIKDASSPAALGVAYGVAHLWHEPMARPVVHPILLQLLRSGDEDILTALTAIFLHDGFAVDTETKELLDTLVESPNIFRNGRAEHFSEALANLTVSEPDLVCRVAHAILDVAADRMGNIGSSWYFGTEWLLDIALKLQDLGEAQRADGSKLFERMLEFNMPQAREMSLDLDKRMPTGNSSRAPRRRSRARIHKGTVTK